MHEFEVGPYDTEGFVDDIAVVGHDDDLAVFGTVGDPYPVEQVFLLIDGRQFAQERRGKAFEILPAAHRGVEHLTQV